MFIRTRTCLWRRLQDSRWKRSLSTTRATRLRGGNRFTSAFSYDFWYRISFRRKVEISNPFNAKGAACRTICRLEFIAFVVIARCMVHQRLIEIPVWDSVQFSTLLPDLGWLGLVLRRCCSPHERIRGERRRTTKEEKRRSPVSGEFPSLSR